MKKNTLVIIRNAAAYDFGGGERFPVFLAENATKDYDPIIISGSSKLLAFAKDRGIKTVRGLWWANQSWSGRKMLLFPIYLVWQTILTAWYIKTFISLRPAVVHAQSKDDFIAASLAGKLCGAKVIWTDHADLKHIWLNVEKPFRNLVGKTVLWAARFTSSITVVSKSEKQLVSSNIERHAAILRKITVIYNGVEDKYTPQIPGKQGEIIFCMASRLVTDKGVSEALDAFKSLNAKYSNIKLLIMGDGPEANHFKEKAKDIREVTLLGHVDQPLDILAKGQVFIHPTYHEGFSVALVEASMMGLPIIATDVGGNPEIILEGETGLLIPSKDSQALAAAMETLILDEKLRSKLGSGAREQYLEKFEFGSIVQKQFLPLYNKS